MSLVANENLLSALTDRIHSAAAHEKKHVILSFNFRPRHQSDTEGRMENRLRMKTVAEARHILMMYGLLPTASNLIPKPDNRPG